MRKFQTILKLHERRFFHGKGIADIAKIKQVLKQAPIKDLAEGTGLARNTIASLKSGARKVEKLNLGLQLN